MHDSMLQWVWYMNMNMRCLLSVHSSAFTWHIQLGLAAHRHIEVARLEPIHEVPRALEPGRGRRGDRLEYRVG
jgi:hypothetical protein